MESGGDQRVFSYVPPPNLKHRNAALVSHVTEALRTPAALDEFLQMSALFRQGSVTADAYHSHCREAMGSEAFVKIFPELLVLLPDIEKQQVRFEITNENYMYVGLVSIRTHFDTFCVQLPLCLPNANNADGVVPTVNHKSFHEMNFIWNYM